MSDDDALKTRPWSFDLLGLLQRLETETTGKPRIGDSAVIAEEIVHLGQDPFLDFPAANVSRIEWAGDGTPVVYSRFLGFFGPQGALPLDMSVEASDWFRRGDPSFARFADIFASRFLQLFYRAFADARPIAGPIRRGDDRFSAHIGALAGFGSPASRERDRVPDMAKLPFAGLVASRVKSASRLAALVRGVLDVEVEVEERVGCWLAFEPGDRTRLGLAASDLGMTIALGQRAHSINDKLRLKLTVRDLAQYDRFLPGGDLSGPLFDLVFFYLGHRLEFDVELALPAAQAPGVRLGRSGRLGWTSWIAPHSEADTLLRDARFSPRSAAA